VRSKPVRLRRWLASSAAPIRGVTDGHVVWALTGGRTAHPAMGSPRYRREVGLISPQSAETGTHGSQRSCSRSSTARGGSQRHPHPTVQPANEEAYTGWIRRYVRFCGMRHPRELNGRDVERFLSHLANWAGLAMIALNRQMIFRSLHGVRARSRIRDPRSFGG
jgi:hypothetical protein